MTADAPAVRTAPFRAKGAGVLARARTLAGASVRPARIVWAIIARRLRVATPLGWALAGTAVLGGGAGLVWGWAEAVAVGAAAVIALLLGIGFVIGRTEYRVSVELAAARVVVGESAVGRVVVQAAGRRGSPSSWIVLPVGQAKAQFRVPRLARDAEHDELFQIPTHRRAILTLGPVTSQRTDPLGTLRREVAWTEPTELYVHPRTVTLDGDSTGLMRDLEGLPTRDLADDDVSFHALREYVPGDDLRYVHWKSTARTQRLMIRQFEQTRRSQLAIALSARAEDYADDDEFELAVSMAGSLAVSAMREGKDVLVVASAQLLHAPTPTRLLDLLSGVERTAGAADAAQTARIIASSAPATSIVTFVVGSAVAPQQLRAAATRIPPAARAVALRAVTGAASVTGAAGAQGATGAGAGAGTAGSASSTTSGLARRVIGDLVAVDVPELGLLRRAMRAVAA